MSPLDDVVLSSALSGDWAKADKRRLTPSRSMTTAGSSSVPFLEMVFPFLLVTSALPALTSATVPAMYQLLPFASMQEGGSRSREWTEEGERKDKEGE